MRHGPGTERLNQASPDRILTFKRVKSSLIYGSGGGDRGQSCYAHIRVDGQLGIQCWNPSNEIVVIPSRKVNSQSMYVYT